MTSRQQGGGSAAPAETDPQEIRRLLSRSVNRVCPRWLADRREDIVQNAYLRILQAREKMGEYNPTPPASYFWKVAHNATVDEIRRIRRGREVSQEDASPVGDGPAAAGDPFDDASLGDLGRGVLSCLERLGEPRRIAVCFHLMGFTLAESERMSGWHGKRVRNLLHRGMLDLRRCLTRKGFQP